MDVNCNLPNECDCELCEYWQDNGWDLSRTPSWQQMPKSMGEANDWEIMEEGEEY